MAVRGLFILGLGILPTATAFGRPMELFSRQRWRLIFSVTRKNRQMSIKVAKNDFTRKKLPKNLVYLGKSNKSPNLVTLLILAQVDTAPEG